MKKILFILLVIFCNNYAFSQMKWETVPKVIVDEVGNSKTITGIQTKIISNIELDTNYYKSYDLYISFIDSQNQIHSARNVNTNDFIKKIVGSGKSLKFAQDTVRNIFLKLIFGTKEEMKQSAAILAGLYNYTLK